MAYLPGRDCAVKLGTTLIGGMGTVNVGGAQSDQIETSAFGTTWKTFELGMRDGGTISFDGYFDLTDASQQALILANLECTDVTTLKIYVNNSSYYEPCMTTGYFTKANSTGNDTIRSALKVTSYQVSADKNDMVRVSFEAKVSGCMVLV